MEGEMARTVPWRHRYRLGRIRGERPCRRIEFPNLYTVESQIASEDILACGVGFDHVPVWMIVSADSEAARRCALRLPWPDLTRLFFDIRGSRELPIRKHAKHGKAPAGVIGHEHIASGRVNAQMRRPSAL